MKLVIVDSYDSFTFNLLQMLGEIAEERPIVVKNDEVGAREIEAMRPAGVVMSPGPGHPREAGRLIEIVKTLDPKIPLLGVCLGHQAIVEAEGGTVLSAGEIMHGKTSEVHHDGGALFDGISSPFVATRYHSLAAERTTLPATLRENARTLDGTIMSVEHTTRPVFGVQFHPESMATGAGRAILVNFIDLCRRTLGAPEKTVGPDHSFASILESVLAGVNLSRDIARSLAERALNGRLTPTQVGALALALRAKGEHTEEVIGFALALRNVTTPARSKRSVVNVNGTGGDGHHTFNISTGAALVMAGAGLVVAKNALNTQTASAGGADVLRALGVPLETHADQASRALDEIGIAFFAPGYSESFRNIPSTQEVGQRTVFSLALPLTNPAGAHSHFVGVFSDKGREVVIRALKAMGARRALVVRGDDGMDELTTVEGSHVTELFDDGKIVESKIDPRELGIPLARREDLVGGDISTNADILRRVFDGEKGPRRDIVALNAAAGLFVGGAASDLHAGLARAYEAIDSGAVARVLARARTRRKVEDK